MLIHARTDFARRHFASAPAVETVHFNVDNIRTPRRFPPAVGLAMAMVVLCAPMGGCVTAEVATAKTDREAVGRTLNRIYDPDTSDTEREVIGAEAALIDAAWNHPTCLLPGRSTPAAERRLATFALPDHRDERGTGGGGGC